MPNTPEHLNFSDSGPQPFDPLDMISEGFYVFPIQGHRKYPLKVAGEAWSYYWDNQRRDILAGEVALDKSNPATTGWCIAPHKTDKHPLLLVDLDVYEGRTPEDLWPDFAGPNVDMPENIGITRSTGGGYHFWFALPEHLDSRSLPASFNFGSGIEGEIRFSGQDRPRILVLPGTRATNKSGKIGTYTVAKPFNVANLPDPPPELIARLQGRVGTSSDELMTSANQIDSLPTIYTTTTPREDIVASKMPTEFHHLMAVVQQCHVTEGGRNNFAAMVSQIVGRIYKARPNDVTVKMMVDTIQAALEEKLPLGELKKTIYSAMKRGQANAKRFDVVDKHPSTTVVLQEVKSIYQKLPWLLVHLKADGKVQAFELGLGGSAKRPDEVTHSMTLTEFSKQTVLAALSRLSGCDLDVVVRSPIFTRPNWLKVLMHYLEQGATYEYTTLPTDAVFWDTLQQWAMQAASDKIFTENVSKALPEDTVIAHTKVDVAGTGKKSYDRLVLIVHPRHHEFLLTQCGDIGATKKLLRTHADERKVTYSKRRADAWFIEITPEHMSQETNDYLWAEYVAWKRGQVDEA